MNRDIVFKGFVGWLIRRFTATSAAGAVTARGRRVQITTEALNTAAAASYTLTITNKEIKADSFVIAKVEYGTSTTGEPVVSRVTEAEGSVVVIIKNVAAAAAFNGSLIIDLIVIPNSPTP